MTIKRFRIYADTSVFGGCYDSEFKEDSLCFFKDIKSGRYILLLTEVVLAELQGAPEKVRDILKELPPSSVELINLNDEIIALRDAYIAAGIIKERWLDDATHVAAATAARADAIVSWNFKHIVRLDKMKQYNEVNLFNGYGILTIISPKELMSDED